MYNRPQHYNFALIYIWLDTIYCSQEFIIILNNILQQSNQNSQYLIDRPRPIMLKILPFMFLSSAQKSYLLYSKLCPPPLQLCHSSYTVLIFLITPLAQLGSSLLCFISCCAAVLLYFKHYAQYYANINERTCTSFSTKLA